MQAAAAYDKAALYMYGSEAQLNLPRSSYEEEGWELAGGPDCCHSGKACSGLIQPGQIVESCSNNMKVMFTHGDQEADAVGTLLSWIVTSTHAQTSRLTAMGLSESPVLNIAG